MFLRRIYLSLKYTIFIFVHLMTIKYKAMKIKIKGKKGKSSSHMGRGPHWLPEHSGWTLQQGALASGRLRRRDSFRQWEQHLQRHLRHQRAQRVRIALHLVFRSLKSICRDGRGTGSC